MSPVTRDATLIHEVSVQQRPFQIAYDFLNEKVMATSIPGSSYNFLDLYLTEIHTFISTGCVIDVKRIVYAYIKSVSI